MYKEASKRVGDSPKHSEKSVISGTVQKRASKAGGFLKPNQSNLFRYKEQQVIQEKRQLEDIRQGSLRKRAIEKSDQLTHFKHMDAGEKIGDRKAFFRKSHEKSIAQTEQQAINRITGEIQELENKKDKKKEDKGKKKEDKDKKKEDEDRIIQLMKNNTGLPDSLKSGVESLSGLSMNDVKVHYNSSRPAQLHALAYTQGADIHVAPGQEKHLPHEAWHVVQQKQHRVKPTMQKMDISINDDTALEREADIMGAKAAVQGKADSASALYPPGNAATERKASLRCMYKDELDKIKDK